MGRSGRRRKQLLDDHKEKKGCQNLKEEVLDLHCVENLSQDELCNKKNNVL
jgi:hypothetical protein